MATQSYRIWIQAEPAAIWKALTDREELGRYGYGGDVTYELRPGGTYRAASTPEMLQFGAPEVMCEGEVLEVEPGTRLVQLWRAVWDEQIAAEPASRLTYEIRPLKHGVSLLSLTVEIDGAPITEGITTGAVEEAGGGFMFVLSDLKSLLETGSAMPSQMG